MRPALMIAVLLLSGASLIYGLGGPTWIVYTAIVPTVLCVLPAEERWERRQHPW